MLPEIIKFEEVATLVSHSGVQFMDFGLTLDPRREPAGEFKYLANTPRIPTRLLVNQESGEQFHVIEREGAKDKIETVREPDFDVPMATSLQQLDGAWLPVPFLRFRPPSKFDQGPANWARMRLVALDEPDLDGHTHRLTLAFDTRTLPHRDNTTYLCPADDDISAGANFRLATMTIDMKWFMDKPWVKEWLEELFREANPGLDSQQMEEAIDQERLHLAHYLNVLSLLHRPIKEEHRDPIPRIAIPDIRVITQTEGAIPVDLVLDVGNSRTCGILIEDHGQSGMGLKHNYVLELRDLVDPERVYREPFESRVEFSQTFFGKDHLSVKSGRHDAFLWPTIARVGDEAGRLAGRRRGTEGSTGLSSPKRYLWDEELYRHGWRFNSAYVRTDTEPHATAAPFSHLINEQGDALYAVSEEKQMPVFKPHYSRSSLMTFMLAEVLAQALMQINSPAQRVRQGHTNRPRQLRSITLTVPPAMPQAERSLLVSRLEQSVVLVWKSLGWHNDKEESDPFKATDATLRAPMPKLRVEWDEASCGQLVYLYTEIKENFAGHPEEFFDALARSGKPDRERISLGTIDIGGGTTDLVITDYHLDRNGSGSSGSNVFVVPEQRFRDGFRVAGDDILLDVIQLFVLPSFEAALKQAGIASPDAMMSRLCGQEGANAQEQVLRQQLNLQVFTPLGLALLEAYEGFDPEKPSAPQTLTYGERLGELAVSDPVRRYVESALRRELGPECEFNLLGIPLTINLLEVHRAFLKDRFNICKTLASLCEVVFQYQCDSLLITGRPSRLPGIQAYLRKMLPLPPGRILPLQGYRTGSWYPFHRNGRIDDPKSTASVGAMLCLLCTQRNLSNFFFRATALRPYSTIRHIGLIDNNNTIPDVDVTYRDIATNEDDTAILLPKDENGDTPAIEMRGPLRIGFRQLAAQRWPASPLYVLDVTPSGARKLSTLEASGETAPVLQVRLAVNESASKGSLISDRLEVVGVETNGNSNFTPKDLKLQLNTLIDAGLGDTNYWLDSGSVKRT